MDQQTEIINRLEEDLSKKNAENKNELQDFASPLKNHEEECQECLNNRKMEESREKYLENLSYELQTKIEEIDEYKEHLIIKDREMNEIKYLFKN